MDFYKSLTLPEVKCYPDMSNKRGGKMKKQKIKSKLVVPFLRKKVKRLVCLSEAKGPQPNC